MKNLFSTIVLATSLTLVLFTSCYFPGSDQAKIKSATAKYVKAQLVDGEEFQWEYLERKNGCHVAGRDCKYAEVHYSIIDKEGNKEHKMLFLLMSQHCDSVYDITEERDKEWNAQQYPTAEEVNALIKEVLN